MEIQFALIVLGSLLLLGLLADEVGRRTKLPRVTLLMLFGVAVGPSGFNFLPVGFEEWYEFLTSVALSMVAFLLGGHLSLENLREHGRAIIAISLVAVLTTGVVVSVGLIAAGIAVPLALLLAGAATATDPAATEDVVRQTRSAGPFTSKLLGVVAVDDAWGLILFAFILVACEMITGGGSAMVLVHGLWEVGGAMGVGLLVGCPAAYLTGRLKQGEPMQAEAIGVVLLVGGLSIWLEVSYLLAGMTAGAIVANFASHHKWAFHEIENVEWPFMVLFFIFAGATFHIGEVAEIGTLGLAYIGLRLGSRIIGGWLGGLAGAVRPVERNWMGMALAPQAGVAIGMALVGAAQFPAYRDALLAVTVGTTVVFELAGPIFTQIALHRAGEIGRMPAEKPAE